MNTTTDTTMSKPALESETCTRCHGSGKFSFCPGYGDTCFRCKGKGRTLTDRGEAASKYLSTLRSKAVRDIEIGDKFWFAGVSGYIAGAWVTVTEIAHYDNSRNRSTIGGVEQPLRNDLLTLSGVDAKGETYGMSGLEPESLIRVAQTPEQVQATLLQAIEYQGTLTKKGTPRKRAA